MKSIQLSEETYQDARRLAVAEGLALADLLQRMIHHRLRKIRLHQLNPQRRQRGQLRPLAAIAARHLPARRHQLFTEIKSESTAAARYQCTHTISFPFHGLA